MKVRSEDILKPGAVLKVERINFSDPEVKAFVEESKKKQAEILRFGRNSHRVWNLVVTI